MKKRVNATPRPVKPLLAALLALSMVIQAGCSQEEITSTAKNMASAVIQGESIESVVTRTAVNKAERYIRDPERIKADWQRLKTTMASFREKLRSVWGKGNTEEESNPKRYVKYTDHYLSRAEIAFDNGRIRVETLDADKPLERLEGAIVATLLTPEDPRQIDLFSDTPVPIGGTPYLLGQVVDQKGRDINNESRARDYARHLIKSVLKTRTVTTPKGKKTGHSVEFAMTARHQDIRAKRFKPLVERYAEKYGLSRALVYSVIRTESAFNPYAVSHIPAFGLMQIVPKTAGRDTWQYLYGKKGTPSKDYLFDPERNIEMGTAYMDLLEERYLGKVRDPLAREYCMIAAYNGGIGRVLRLFGKGINGAQEQINTLSASQVHDRLKSRMPKETQHYLIKVLENKKRFVAV
ncbi:MAG: DUF3393 domain-containing protein [Magnetococcales bacterium]|nr:DUF3393 domain-containing protein [Magnetococcales bacterium]